MRKFWRECSNAERAYILVSLGWAIAFVNWVYWVAKVYLQ
jgi:hypothetical protein